MKNECNIVKDLLPLYIDGVVSEDSRRLVEEHTALCEDCGEARREMMLALPENREPQVEQSLLKKAAQKLRRKHKLRGGLIAILGLMIGLVLIYGGRALRNYLKYDFHVPVQLDAYDMRLSKLSDDQVICSLVPGASTPYFINNFDTEWAEDNSGLEIRFYATTTIIPLRDIVSRPRSWEQFELRDGQLYKLGTNNPIVKLLRTDCQGTEEVIYQYGADGIAPASEEMEQYYQLENDIEAYYELKHLSQRLAPYIDEEALPFDDIAWGSEDFDERLAIYSNQLKELRTRIPEWQ